MHDVWFDLAHEQLVEQKMHAELIVSCFWTFDRLASCLENWANSGAETDKIVLKGLDLILYVILTHFFLTKQGKKWTLHSSEESDLSNLDSVAQIGGMSLNFTVTKNHVEFNLQLIFINFLSKIVKFWMGGGIQG